MNRKLVAGVPASRGCHAPPSSLTSRSYVAAPEPASPLRAGMVMTVVEAKAGQGCPAYVLPSPYQYYHSHHEYDSAYNNSPDCIVFDLLVG
ncbi:MAG: hypothetical protein H5T62_17795, partial [Anaerolineae bacterium]|nr:hypothetical protein [Anaerolineae bacterium]